MRFALGIIPYNSLYFFKKWGQAGVKIADYTNQNIAASFAFTSASMTGVRCEYISIVIWYDE